MKIHKNHRKGAVAVLLGFLMLPLLALLALSVDYGFLLYMRTELQRVADQSVLAAARELTPDADGNQDFAKVRSVVRDFVQYNFDDSFEVRDEDIEIGRYDPSTIYSSITLLNDGVHDTVRVRIRRDDVANNSVSLYFARLFGNDDLEVAATATAVLQKARYLGPGTPVFPIAVEEQTWNQLSQGETMSVYGDGRIENSAGQPIPGNFGTVDVGPTSNGTSQLNEQILNGLSQNDIDSLYNQNRIPNAEYIDSQQSILPLNADPGFSSGIKHSVSAVEGELKILPIYGGTNTSGGNNFEYEIIGWTAVEIVDSRFQGNKKSYIEVRKSYIYNANMLPGNSLSDTTIGIENGYTIPVLIE